MVNTKTIQLSIVQETIQLLETTENGILQVHEITRNIDQSTGAVYGESHWRTTLAPTDTEEGLAQAQEILTEKNFEIALLLWDEEVVTSYRALQEKEELSR